MKLMLLALGLICASTLAQATPAAGDSATFAGTTVTQQGQPVQFQAVITLTQFDASKNAYLETSTITAPGIQPVVEQKWIAATDLLNDATLNYVVSNCASQHGTNETLTVPAGTFNTCRITQQDGTVVNVGAGIPFGIVKEVQPSQHLDMSLISFQLGH